VRTRPQRILIERGGGPGGETLRAELDPTSIPPDVAGALTLLLDETRPPTDNHEAEDTAYDVILDYGDHEERLRYNDDELPGDIREALDARLTRGA
jgi:hypothetical protein